MNNAIKNHNAQTYKKHSNLSQENTNTTLTFLSSSPQTYKTKSLLTLCSSNTNIYNKKTARETVQSQLEQLKTNVMYAALPPTHRYGTH